MNTPGVSLFQGVVDNIKVDSSFERREEEEALQDQRRRNEELGNLLQNAFDDLEDDETTLDSTNFPSDLLGNDNNQNEDVHREQDEFQKKENYEMEIHRLKMLLSSQSRELESIKEMANGECRKTDELQKRLTIAEAELDRALATKTNTHELLVESKEKCSNLEIAISKLRNEKKVLETENNSLLGKLETSQTLLADIQRKYDMVERDLNKHNNRNAELRLKQMEERHRAEIEMMQQQMEQLANKLEKRTSEFESMSARYRALQSSHENMLVEKASRVNDLNNALNEAQKKCEELLNKQDYFQDNVRLQKFVASLQDQIQAMEKTITSLKERLEFTTAELDVMDSLLHQYNIDDTPHRLNQTPKTVVDNSPLNTVDRLGNLKNELYRALANVKGKREEIRKLQHNLDERNTEICALKEEENKSLVQITTLKENNIRLENRLKILEEEYEEMHKKQWEGSVNHEKIQMVGDELKQLKEEKEKWEKQKIILERERNNLEAERKKIDINLKNVVVDLEELKQEHESMKINFDQILKENQSLRSHSSNAEHVHMELEKHKLLLKDSQNECDRLKNLYVEISNEKEALGYEIEKIRNTDSIRELQNEREKVGNLKRALELAEIKSGELAKVLETEKLCHEREMNAMKEKWRKEKSNHLMASKNNAKSCSKCIEYMAEITKFEIQNLKLKNVNSVSKKEVSELTQKLNDAKTLVAELKEKLELTEYQEELIKELKAKGNQIEELIKINSIEKNSSCPSKLNSPTNSHALDLENTDNKKVESRIRDEMAKIFASDLKRYQIKVHQIEEKNLCLQREYQYITGELQQRQTEVELLKQAILAEREKMQEILERKETECQDIVQKLNAMLHKCRNELKMKNQRVTELSKELHERQSQIEAERQSMKAVMQQWEQQSKTIDTIESDWEQKLQNLKKIHDSAVESWQTKYNSAKRTAVNYKRYAEDKETHMLKEYDRIKLEYDTALAKIELRFKETMLKKHHEIKSSVANIEKRELTNNNDKENRATN